MNRTIKRRIIPGSDIFDWLSPVGGSVRLFFQLFSLQAVRKLDLDEMKEHCYWMGIQSFHFIAISAALVSIALTIQCVVELQKFQAQDLAGACITVGLLREIGPITISVAWNVMVAAHIAEDARTHYPRYHSDTEFARGFILPRYLCALAMAIPLSTYGLVFGFITGALFAPLIGVTSVNDFLESARQTIRDKDVVVYVIKLCIVNPTVSTFAGAICGMRARHSNQPVAASAVLATFLVSFALNLAVTVAFYLQGEPNL